MAGTGTAHLRPVDEVLLQAEHLVVNFPAAGGKTVSAVADVSFDVAEGETLGVVGESGCGKSTAARALLQLPAPTSGSVRFAGHDLTVEKGERLRALRPQLQIVFQDPISSLNPRRTVGDIVGAPLRIWKRGTPDERKAKVDEALDAVGLDPEIARDKRPHEFSGGQCQRICIARALVLEPKLIICDEPVSALDVSVQAQILNLLKDLKARYGLTLVFITHDLAVVKNVSDRVAVMYLGKMCELATPDQLYASPAHPYTAALLSSIPVPDPRVTTLSSGLVPGDLPSPLDPPSGCRFRTRCPRAQERCAAEQPQIREVADGQFVACHFPLVGDVAPAEAVQSAVQPISSGGNGAGTVASGGDDSTPEAPSGPSDAAPGDAPSDTPAVAPTDASAGDGARAG